MDSRTQGIQSASPQTLLLTLAEVAKHLRVSKRQVHRLLSSGRLPPADVSLGGIRGRRWRSDRLQAWIEAGCRHASQGSKARI